MAGLAWWELRTPDVGTASKFYTELLGWQLEEMMPNYHVVKSGGESIGALSGMSPSAPTDQTSTILYFEVDDLKGAVAKATELGGVVLSGPDVISEEAGAYADVRDPSGVVFGLWAQKL